MPIQTKPLARKWREVLTIHPAAEFFPLMTPGELKALGEDIHKKNRLLTPVTVWKAQKHFPPQLLDGRNRLDAIETFGFTVDVENVGTNSDPAIRLWMDHEDGRWPIEVIEVRGDHGVDPYAYVVGANIHRRHLTGEQKRDIVAALLKDNPQRSNSATAKIAKVDDKTVGAVRAEMEARSEIPNVSIRTDSRGRNQQSRKTRKPTTKPATDKPKTGNGVQAIRDAAATHVQAPVSGQPEPQGAPKPARDDVGADSRSEAERLRVRVEELQAEKRRPETKVAGLEREVEDLKPALHQGPPIDESPEEYWQRSLTALADEVIVRTTYHWPDGWKTFGVPPHLLEHVMHAMTAWCDLVKQLSTQPVLPPPTPKLSAPPPDDGLDIPECRRRVAP